MTETATRNGWPPAILDDALAVMRLKHGLDIACYEETFLTASLEKRCQALGADTPASYLERLAQDPAEVQIFDRSLHIVYSEFFRNPLSFALLEQSVLPVLVGEKAGNPRAEIRIWSAGCAAGQETWSVAILVQDIIDKRGGRGNYRIFATDRSEPHLDAARAGVYSPEALGNLRWRHVREYFSPCGASFAINDRLREHVEYSCYDLLEEGTTCPPTSIYGDFDLVLCSNVLLYYRPEVRGGIVNKLRRCLAPGGYLMTGEVEGPIVAHAGGFRPVAPSVALFRKT